MSDEYGVTPPTFNQAKASFEGAGIAGLVPRKRGRRGPHKIQNEVLASLKAQLSPGEPIRARELTNLVRGEFGLDVHPRTIERALGVKKRRDRRRATALRDALADTLILDEDDLYDPANFNDRLLLGLKGTMSEAKLHVIKARLRGGILNKVRRGEYRCVLPTGLTYEEVGHVVLDPDSRIRKTIAHFFEKFSSRVGSASQTVKAFATDGLFFPSRLRNQKQVVFQPLTISTTMRTLHNPRYAGAYAYGRRRYRRTVDGKKQLCKREPNDWLA